jgi:hypothetical protein
MGIAVDFDREARFDAVEVGKVNAEGMLAAKLLAAALAITQVLPEPVLAAGARLPQAARELNGVKEFHAKQALLLQSGPLLPEGEGLGMRELAAGAVLLTLPIYSPHALRA